VPLASQNDTKFKGYLLKARNFQDNTDKAEVKIQ
jgi:hypothetical protein